MQQNYVTLLIYVEDASWPVAFFSLEAIDPATQREKQPVSTITYRYKKNSDQIGRKLG